MRKYYRQYGSNHGYILFGDFSKFYDNILHDVAKKQLLDLVDNDPYLSWILDEIFEFFEIDATNMTDEEFEQAKNGVFNKLNYDPDPNNTKTKTIKKSINIGDQLSQLIGIYYPHKIDNYIKIVCGEKYYGRYMDDWYIISPDRDHLLALLNDIVAISETLGLHVNLDKTRICPIDRPFNYLQIKYRLTSTGRIIRRINPKRVTAMRRKLKKLVSKVEENKISYEYVDNMFCSWIGSFYKLMSRQQIDNLFELYELLFDCTISVYGNKIFIERNYHECTV